MNPKLLIVSVVLLSYCVSMAVSKDLLVKVIGGNVRKKDTFTTDPYMSVTVCNQKKQTPTLANNLNPRWNWEHQFTNVQDTCRLKFHLYDHDRLKDDTIGEWETTVGAYFRERTPASTITFGKKSDSSIQVVVQYKDTFVRG